MYCQQRAHHIRSSSHTILHERASSRNSVSSPLDKHVAHARTGTITADAAESDRLDNYMSFIN